MFPLNSPSLGDGNSALHSSDFQSASVGDVVWHIGGARGLRVHASASFAPAELKWSVVNRFTWKVSASA